MAAVGAPPYDDAAASASFCALCRRTKNRMARPMRPKTATPPTTPPTMAPTLTEEPEDDVPDVEPPATTVVVVDEDAGVVDDGVGVDLGVEYTVVGMKYVDVGEGVSAARISMPENTSRSQLKRVKTVPGVAEVDHRYVMQ